MNIIEINSLTKYYGKSRGIIDVSFSIEEGEIFGFIGPNGSGKTTTIRTLLALIYPTSGSATIFGKDCIKFAPEIAKNIGYLPSEVFYYDKMKVIDLLKYSASFYKKDCTKKINELAEIMDLDLKKRIDDLSFGNKKKVGIVQCLLHDPKLIILDEPTSGLDPLMQKNFFDLLKEENRKGATIFLSSHVLGEVQKMCNRVAIIKEGKIINVDKISDLTENNYKKFRIEIKTHSDLNHENVTSRIADSESEILKNYFAINGVSSLEINNNTVNFLFKGNINNIIRKISEMEIANVWIDEPTLEEIFMHYYTKED